MDELGASAIPVVVPWVTLAATTATISILNIPQTFTSLKLFALLRTNQAAMRKTSIPLIILDSSKTPNIFGEEIATEKQQ